MQISSYFNRMDPVLQEMLHIGFRNEGFVSALHTAKADALSELLNIDATLSREEVATLFQHRIMRYNFLNDLLTYINTTFNSGEV